MTEPVEPEDFHYRRLGAPRPRAFGLALVGFTALLFVLPLVAPPRRAIPSDAVAPPFSALAPVLASTTPATSTAALATSSTLPPVVLMHGMGDAGTSEGMRSVAEAIRQAFPGRHVVSLDVANGMDSALVTMDAQVAAIAAAVAADKRLAGGFDAVGLSQGALLMRAFVERHGGDYKVRKLFSLCGPQEGIGRCPQVAMYQALCPVFEMDPYGAEVPIAFSGYWKDVRDEKAYLEHNHFLPDVNNERPRRNETYRENMLALEAYVLVHATADSMIVPRESELHGFFAWGDTTGRKIVPMEASDGYATDAIGLKTLAESGRLHRRSFDGDHLQFNRSFLEEQVLPLLG